MVKTLTKLGNSKALIIPAELIKKCGLDAVILEEKAEGILIRSAKENTSFQKAVKQRFMIELNLKRMSLLL